MRKGQCYSTNSDIERERERTIADVGRVMTGGASALEREKLISNQTRTEPNRCSSRLFANRPT